MPVEIDGFAVLAAIGRAPDSFPAVKADVAKAAKAFVGKQLKQKTLTLEQLRGIANAVSIDAFDLIADGMSDAEIKGLLSKVDKHNPELKSGGPEQRRSVAALARGSLQPTAKAGAPGKAPVRKEPKAKVERSGNSRAMSARKKVG